ncbi:hypothetical protein EV580_5453 [Mycobacterium sp. BK086]|uniref:hypothetical protein n=1 Tax=Mycobacterium sp. BK086 TaxID=2512165 RepID=UPI00105CDEA8|nr:hypothetical protein [Mycobacterium sp. BK086]TDO07884.1 hypothetical protein EV580_5453 [Mycobacterium sp. BK086]
MTTYADLTDDRITHAPLRTRAAGWAGRKAKTLPSSSEPHTVPIPVGASSAALVSDHRDSLTLNLVGTPALPLQAGRASRARARHYRRTLPSLRHMRRMALLLAFTLVAFGGIFFEVARSIAGGAPIAYLAVLPILLAMVAFGCSAPPRGVGDAEADWILAGIVGGLALLLRFLMEHRLPTLSGLWHLPLIGAVIWTAVAGTILFGVRRVANKWPLWLFALCTVTPVPYLMLTAALGGSTVASSSVAAAVGAIAVFLAGRQHALAWRLAATMATALFGVTCAMALAHVPLIASVAVSAGVVPVASFVALNAFGARRQWELHVEHTPVPRRSFLSVGLLAAVSVLLLVLNSANLAGASSPAVARANWQTVSGLVPTQHFGFIHRYLGNDASFTRYTVPARDGYPQAAVDVITDDNLEALRAYRDVVWYPAAVTPNYAPINLGNVAVPQGRVVGSDSSSVTDADASQWYAITWLWRAGDKYQQVFVVLNQDPVSKAAPPLPAMLTVHDVVTGPALWLTRQQASPSVVADPLVTVRARQVVSDVLSAGAPRRA